MSRAVKGSFRKHIGLFSLLGVIFGFVVFKFFLPPLLGPGIVKLFWYGLFFSFFEAGIAGGFADWFAVTALFRYPLGIPIPHTNLLVEKRRSIQDNIEGMIRQLLAPENIREAFDRVDVPEFLANLVRNPNLRPFIHREAPRLFRFLLSAFSEGRLGVGVEKLSGYLKDRVSYADQLAIVLQNAQDDGMIERITSQVLEQSLKLFDRNSGLILDYLGLKVRKSRGMELLDRVLSFFTGKDVKQQFLLVLRSELSEVAHEPEHVARKSIRSAVSDYIIALQSDEKTRDDTENWFLGFFKDIDLTARLQGLLDQLLAAMRDDLEKDDGFVVALADGLIDLLAEALRREEFKANLDQRLKEVVIGSLDSRVINWVSNISKIGLSKMSDEQFSGFIEERVKEDLQYIRLNGAVVGGLAGMVLFLVKVLVP
ncbi:MAG TPA: DUF445 domain-containing protein [Chroococcales cyanobacterium]